MASSKSLAMLSAIEKMVWWGRWPEAQSLMDKLVARETEEEIDDGERFEENSYYEQEAYETDYSDADPYTAWLASYAARSNRT